MFEMPENVSEAVHLQKTLQNQIDLSDLNKPYNIIAGVDVGYDYKRNLSKSAVAIFDRQSKSLLQTAIAYDQTTFPYVSGLLSFREIPVILKALSVITIKPDILMVDGQGIAHPRRMGIATHLGLVTKIPSLGVAKSKLCGQYDEVGTKVGDYSELYHGEQIGFVLRSRINVKPIFISPGHGLSMQDAHSIAMEWGQGYKLPEPTRVADKISKF